MDRLLGDLAQYQATQQQLEMLQKLSDQQNAKIQGIHERILPLSPTGQISGLGESGDGYFGGGDGGLGEPGGYDLNMDSFVNDDDFFTSTGDAANPEVMAPEQKSSGANGAVSSAANNANGGIPDFTFDDSTPFDVVDGVNGGGDPAFDFADTTANGMGEDDSGLLSVNGGGNGNEEGVSNGGASSTSTSPAGSATVEEVEDETRRGLGGGGSGSVKRRRR
jgi:heat shock transcription factor